MFYFQMLTLPRWVLGLTLSFQAATNSSLPPELMPGPVFLDFLPPAPTGIASEPAPPQQTTEPFEWASVWTLQAVEGNSAKTPTGTWYNQARLDDVEERLVAISGITGEDARKVCVPLKETKDLLEDGLAYTLTFTQMSPEQKAFLGLVSITDATPTGQIILGDQLPSDIILCGTENTSSNLGAYYPEHRFIAVEFRNVCRGMDFLPAPFGFYPENFGAPLFAFMEEATHAWQNVVRDIYQPKNSETSWAADLKLWDLATEAHAKLISSVMMVEYFLNGGQADVAEIIKKDDSLNVALLNTVMAVYLEHGKKTVEKNPSLLLPAFLSFFEDPNFMQAYFHQSADTVNEAQGMRRIPFREFQDAFGKLPGMKGNMFSGVSQKEKSLDAVIAHIAPDTEMRQWFDAQIAARAEGRQGPPIPVPEEGEEEEDCGAQPVAQLADPSPN